MKEVSGWGENWGTFGKGLRTVTHEHTAKREVHLSAGPAQRLPGSILKNGSRTRRLWNSSYRVCVSLDSRISRIRLVWRSPD
jgi:hypothetical protein